MNEDFYLLVLFLREHGYIVDYKIYDKNSPFYLYAQIQNKKIFGIISLDHNNKSIVAFDHLELFDKPTKCPFILHIPKNKRQREYILKQMRFIVTDEGYNLSNNYQMPLYFNILDDYNRLI